MSLWVQPLFGDLIEVSFPSSPPLWRSIYQFLHHRLCPDRKLHDLRLYYNGSTDLSTVSEGALLHVIVTDPMAERWISEYSITPKENGNENGNITFYHSTLAWYDARWGDPYEDPRVQYRTSLTIHLLVKQITTPSTSCEFTINPDYFRESYGNKEKRGDTVWYSTLREACYGFRAELYNKHKEEVMTEKTCEHLIHLWELYHGTNQHLVDQGRYYDY